jgi:ATP-dependent DNA helicase DinG
MNTQEYLEQFVETFMSENFVWRKGQKESIEKIIEAYDNGSKTVILSAPVGSGKSIIGMASAWILNQKGKKGYILASDIALQEQYEKDFKKYRFNWGSVKGIDNYLCVDNMEKNSLGTCRIRNKMPRGMYCYDSCPYFNARDHAKESETSLLNYAYWLIMQNYANRHLPEEEQLFPPRDFTICDEGHKILDIVQNHYSPRFNEKTLDKLEELTEFFKNYKIKDHSSTFQSVKLLIKALFDFENQDELYKTLAKLEVYLENYMPSIETLKDTVKEEYPKDDPPKEWKGALRLCDWLKDFHCKIEDYVEIIYNTSTRNIVKNPAGDNDLVFNCLEENFMMNKYFHGHTGFTILMSATFADPKAYLKSIALKTASYIKMESTFDFSKSPIYFYNKRRMSYNQIDANLPWLNEKINEILDNHPKENGIIHSASYNLTMKIHQSLSSENKKRILVYEGTEEKRKVLEILKRDHNRVLIGPSLTHGLDLSNDLCRFIITAKTPYLSLNDKFVKTKLQINPDWYAWKAAVDVIQGIGRGVRNESDWCITYYLDATLADLIHKNRKSFPVEFYNRLKIVST